MKKFTAVTAAFAAATVHVAVGLVGRTVVVIVTPIVTIGDATNTDTMAVTTVRATTIAAVVASEST
ncbi:MAG: hypothetical protein ABJM29_07305 [Rhizobiaceae bacterium]